jgi:integrase
MRRAQKSLQALIVAGILTDGEPCNTVDVRQFLVDRHLVALRVVEFLTDRGTVSDESIGFDRWLTAHLVSLPQPVRVEVTIWIEALQGRRPRSGQPKKAATIQGYLRVLEPALVVWSSRYKSLREVTGEDVSNQLTAVNRATRLLTLSAMRSLFAALKTERVIFANPTKGLVGRHQQPPPALPVEPNVRSGLLALLDHPEQRLVLLLSGVHALRTSQIRHLRLDEVDMAQGTLLVKNRRRPLDRLTGEVLRAWLDRRQVLWPVTANPYVLINQSTAGGTKPVTRSFVEDRLQPLGDVTPHDLRVDRFLAEVHATGGDPLKLTRLFGVSDPTAIRYCNELGPLDQLGGE